MRVISGKYQRKVILNYKDNAIRPTMDRAKEGIFNVINMDIIDSDFLDVFSGTGSIAIEAVSRGAGCVDVVEKDRYAVKLIKSNLEGIEEEVNVFQSDALSFSKKCQKKYDYIFLDPPYDYDLNELEEIFKNFSTNLKINGQLIIELGMEYKKSIDSLEKQKTRKYGKSVFTIFKKEVNE